MQASKAPTETRVPRQVAMRVANATARYAPEPATPPAANDAPADPPAPPTATPANPPPTDPPVDPRHADPSYWKQRFEVTSGILAREREQRVDERSTANSRITELQTEIHSLRQAAPPAEIDLTTLFSKEEIESYGEEQCRVMARTAVKAAKLEAEKLVDAAVQPLKQRQTTDATNTVEDRKQAFRDKLSELVPDWETTDKDTRWLAWLNEDDDNGVQRDIALKHHLTTGNAGGAAKMFKKFMKTIEVPTPPVAPSGTGAGAGDGAPPPETGLTAPTDAEVKDFYKKSALNKVKDEERVKFEARLKLRNPGR